jgi:TatA/E family protein of Tat protein translocase
VFSLGGSEILIVVVLVLLLFGPDKIPELAKTIGRFRREFDKYKDIVESTVRMEISLAEEGPTGEDVSAEERVAEDGAAAQALLAADTASKVPAAPAAGTDAGAPVPVHASPAPAADETDEEDEG